MIISIKIKYKINDLAWSIIANINDQLQLKRIKH